MVLKTSSVITQSLRGIFAFTLLLPLTSYSEVVHNATAAHPNISNSVPALSLAEQRQHYEKAKKALTRDDHAEFEKHYSKLGDYPLTPYLDYARIKDALQEFDFASIDRFLSANDGTYLGFRLRSQLLHELALTRRWDDFLSYYTADIRSRGLECQHLQARIGKGDKKSLESVAEIWVAGRSHPKVCDPLFTHWKQQGGLTDEVAWARFHNAMQNGKRSLARYIAGLMTDSEKAYAMQYLGVHGYPGRIKQHSRFSEKSERMQQIIAHGIKRYSRIDVKDALNQWERYQTQRPFAPNIRHDVNDYLLLRLTYRGYMQDAEALLTQSDEPRSTRAVEQMLREALREGNYGRVHQWLAYLNEDELATDRWQYWRARVQDELGLTEIEQKSDDIYRDLAQKRSFYGFLSADILGLPYSLEHQPSDVKPDSIAGIERRPAMRRAKELWLKGDYSEAQAEWRFATAQMSQAELAAAGHMARQWGWYNKGIHAMIMGEYWDDLDIRFPLAYRETVEKVASLSSVEPTLIYAIARQESAFSEKAKSSAGARGLMQLMPGTARQTARKSGLRHRDSMLYDPEYNMTLGSQYLNEMLEKFSGNRILAAAAYNAGPHRVNKWIQRTSLDVPFDVWIETIPFKETRGYVQNVLAFSVIYGYRLGHERPLISEEEIRSAEL